MNRIRFRENRERISCQSKVINCSPGNFHDDRVLGGLCPFFFNVSVGTGHVGTSHDLSLSCCVDRISVRNAHVRSVPSFQHNRRIGERSRSFPIRSIPLGSLMPPHHSAPRSSIRGLRSRDPFGILAFTESCMGPTGFLG